MYTWGWEKHLGGAAACYKNDIQLARRGIIAHLCHYTLFKCFPVCFANGYVRSVEHRY